MILGEQILSVHVIQQKIAAAIIHGRKTRIANANHMKVVVKMTLSQQTHYAFATLQKFVVKVINGQLTKTVNLLA